jgi:hypothetical protein
MPFLIPRRLAAVGISASILLLAVPATVLAYGGTHASNLNVGTVQLGTGGGSVILTSDRHGRSELHLGSVDLG